MYQKRPPLSSRGGLNFILLTVVLLDFNLLFQGCDVVIDGFIFLLFLECELHLDRTARIAIRRCIAGGGRTGFVQASDIEKCITGKTRLIAVTAASNVTGTKMPLAEISRIAHRRGILLLVDGAQAAGSMDLNVEKLGIDLLAFPGHKGLLGPQEIKNSTVK